MDFEIADAALERLYYENKGHNKFPPGIGKLARRRIQSISAAQDERTLYQLGGARFEKLKGDRSHQYSMRLNKQWRLILALEKREQGNRIIVLGIEDYH